MMFSVLDSGSRAAKWRHRTLFGGLLSAALAMSMFGCEGSNSANSRATNVLYTESNEPTGNTILAYRRAADGSLSLLTGSPFDLKGLGLENPTENVGPSDADDQFAISADHKLLFAVNSGSNTIAVLNIASDGTLNHIAGSPFPSGGINPISLELLGDKLYCANKNVAGVGTPNYTVFTVATNGALSAPTVVATSPAGSSAAQILAAPDGKTMFTNDFLAPATPAPAGSLRSYAIQSDGKLSQNGSALTLPVVAPAGTPASAAPLYLVTQGVTVHPSQRVFYACGPVSSKIGVYTYDASGVLSFNSFAQTSGLLSCWLLINPTGSRMYVVSTGDNSVSVMNISNPLAPIEIQRLALKDIGPTFSFVPFLPNVGSSTGSEEALDPSGQYLYVVSHRNTTDATFAGGNRLHVLKIAGDGTITEPGPSVNMGTSNRSNAQGLLVL